MTDSLRLLLVDEDPVFRLGLRIWLEQTAGLQVLGEASDGLATLDQIAELTAAEQPPDLVVLDLGLGQGDPAQLPGLQLCQEIKARYPSLAVLVLSAGGEPVLEVAARQMGADGFGRRGMAVQDLGRLIQQTVSGPEPTPPPEPVPLSPWAEVRLNLRRDALTQIEAVLAELALQRRRQLSALERAILDGRQRELRAARRLVGRLLTPATPTPEPAPPPPVSPGTSEALPAPEAAPLAAAEARSLQRGDVESLVFEAVFRQLQGPLQNLSGVPLEIDILREERKRELLYLTLRQLEDAVQELQQARVPPGQLPERWLEVLQDVWQQVTADFFGRYYTLEVANLERPLVKTLLEEAEIVSTAVLAQIPQVPQLLGHLMFREPLMVEGDAYLATTPEALSRSRSLLEHLLVQLANAVVQPLLNRFADVEELKRNLYQRRMMSSRDVDRFRNELSWRYRWDTLVNEPKAVYESQYRLFAFTDRGIQVRCIYAPRRQELERLSGLQLSVTLAIEARDAIAPRLRSAFGLIGSGVVYLLTDVVGRGIGLVGKGILKGIGSAWNEARLRQDRRE